MKERPLLGLAALIAAFTLVLGACRPKPATPTAPPYTPPPPGTVPAIVIQRTPERGEEMRVDGVIELVFDRAMDRDSVQDALQIDPAVKGDFGWPDDRTVRFTPARQLGRDTEYHVTVGASAKAADGHAVDGAYRFRFRTVGYLEASETFPADGAEDVEAASTITVIFNRPVVPLTAVSDPATERLPQPITLEPAVAGSGEWLNTSIYIFRPDEALAGGTRYTAHIAAGLTDTTGGVLEEEYAWTFSTQPPEVIWISPVEDAELVAVDTDIQVTFSMPVDPESARDAFRLQGPSGNVPGTAEVNGFTLTFAPADQLDFDASYKVRVEAGVESASGGRGMRSDYRWQFRTVPLPRIVGTNPQDGEQNAWPHTSFEIEFNAPIDPATVMPNLRMTPPLSPSQVFTYYRAYYNTFVLDFGAEPSTEYEVEIGPDIADPYGNTTGQEMTVRFRTGPLEPWVEPAIPGLVGTLDGNQPARVAVAYLNTTRLDLTLHSIDIDEFFRVQGDWWDYVAPGDPIRSWSVPLEAALNKTGQVLVDLVEDGGKIEPGVYLFEVRSPDVGDDRWRHRRVLVVSKYNITVKTSEDETWAWATDLATGQPVEGLVLSIRGYEAPSLGKATTSDDGVALLPAGFGTASHYDTLFVISQQPFILSGTEWDWQAGISPWDFGLQPGPDSTGLRSFIDTDRPIYRPGQTVYFRGVFRDEDDVRYTIPGDRQAEVEIYDTNGEQIYSQKLTLDEIGTLHSEAALAEGAPLGRYTIYVRIGDADFGAEFQVAAYRPPEFEVTVTPEMAELAAGRATRAETEVRYFFGGPVAGAEVSWNILSAPYVFEPVQFGRFTFRDDDDPWVCPWCWWWEPPRPEVVLSGSGTTDAEGSLTINLPTEVMTGGQRLTVEATVQGLDGQVISGRDEVVVHTGEYYVGLAAQQYVGKAGDELAVDVVTVDWAGERLPRQELDAQVFRREWVNSFVETEYGGSWEWDTVDTQVYTGTLSTDANAEGVVQFVPDEGGSYRVVVSGRDRREREVKSSTWVWVTGPDYVSWRRENNDRITLISDNGTYVPGETAEILIPSPFAGEHWAWITVERGGVLHQEVVRMESNSTVYRLPITPAHAPNVFVSAVIFKGPDATERVATHKVGYVLLTVEPVEQELDITVTPSVERAGPGDTVSFEMEARLANGEPASFASFSADLVDKAVLSLRPREPNAILTAFYGQRGLGVSTASGLAISVNRLLEEELQKLEDEGRGLGMGGGGEADMVAEAPMATGAPAMEAEEGLAREPGAPPAPLPPDAQLREEFADTAFWDATVVTDGTGRATVKIELPDNLTTWVFRSVGVTADTEVGEETADLLVTMPLLVRPVTPRFFVVEDRVQLAALVSNNTGETQDVEVTLHGEGFSLEDPAAQAVTIANGGESKVTWWITVEDVEVADIAMSAVAGTHSDAARPRLTTGPDGTLLVRRYTAPEIVGTGGQLVGEDSRTEVIALPPKYDDREGALTVRLDPSLAAGMTDGLTYLEHFPYECTEQIISRFLPNVLTYRALKELGLSDPELEAKLPGLVEEALEKLYLRQKDDGGWGWWSESESNPYVSAYVVFGLVQARETGFAVTEKSIARGLDYLETQLVSARELDSHREANRQAFIIYVVADAGRGRRASRYVDDLYRHRNKLSHYGRAFAAMTLQMVYGEDSRIDTLLSDLQNAAILSATGAHWEEAEYDRWAMNTDTRSTAVILAAFVELDPDSGLLPQVVRWLMVARRDGIWETTQETAWALIALTDWMVATGELRGQYDYGVQLNDATLAEGSVTPDNVDEQVKLHVDVADLLSDVGNRLTVGRGPGEGRLYYTAHLEVYLPVEEIEPLNRGIILSRQYCDPAAPVPASKGGRQGCQAVEETRVGDVVEVRLTVVAPHDLYYVAVEDPLPAGGEAIDTSLATTSQLAQAPGLHREAENPGWYGFYYWWWRWYSRSELRDDRVVLFADYLPAGTYEYTYTFRATQPGEYRVIPTTAYEFYFPEVFGRADGKIFIITE